MNQSIYISIHIPKTGGSTFQDILQQHFGNRYYSDYADIPIADINHTPMLVTPNEARQRLEEAGLVGQDAECIHGHFLATKYDDAFPNNRKITWLREPLQRAASHFHYWKRTPAPLNPVYNHLLEIGYEFDKFIDDLRLQNLQATYLNNIRLKDLYFIGITEEYDRSIRLFKRMFGIDKQLNINQLNQNPNKQSSVNRYEVKTSHQQAFERSNWKDFQIYREAKDIFDCLCERYEIVP